MDGLTAGQTMEFNTPPFSLREVGDENIPRAMYEMSSLYIRWKANSI